MKNKISDIAVILGKTALGSIPTVGPLVAEIIGNLIPDLRFKRIFALLEALESKIDPEEKEKIEARMLKEKSIDLMEDGFFQAARALSEERIEHIASLLKNSLTDEDLEHLAYKKLLSILSELNDVEVIILKAHSMWGNEQRDFWEKHRKVLTGDVLMSPASQREVDQHAINKTYKANLVRLGLLALGSEQLSQSYEITALGRLLLKSIDQSAED